MALLSGSGTNVAMSYCVRLRCGLDPAWLWLWYMPASVAPDQPPAWELLYATGATLKYKRKRKRNNISTQKKLLKISNLQALFHYTAFFHPKMRKNTVNYKCNIPGLGRPTWLTKHEMCLINTTKVVSKVQLTTGFVSGGLLDHSHTWSFCTVYGSFHIQQPRWVLATLTIKTTTPKMFTIWSFTENYSSHLGKDPSYQY